jgi:hypothetical protein
MKRKQKMTAMDKIPNARTPDLIIALLRLFTLEYANRALPNSEALEGVGGRTLLINGTTEVVFHWQG